MNDRKSITQSSNRDHFMQSSPVRRHIAIFTLIAYIGQPIVATAEIIAAQDAAANTRPIVDATANGLPLVQIATPSAAGVSHNQYTTFNVDPAGSILNNAQSSALTQQAGYVARNPNLVNGSARIILNEVTSANRSQLNGYTEVAGQQADVILANPNGITCNGCGFINTSRGILTTGMPVIGASGSLDAFRVISGDIQIGDVGLNGSNLTQLDLITRSVKVNGELWANTLNVISGSNQVDYNSLGVQVIQGQDTVPTVSIDVAQLGGMYANKIHLISTEAGVGVNSAGTMAALAGDFTLDTQGHITLTGDTNASGNVILNSATGITNSGTLYAQQNAQLTSTGSLSNSGLLTAQDNLTLNAATLNSTGTLAAGIDANGNATQAGDLTLTTQNQTIATGNIFASRNINISATDINLTNSRTRAVGGMMLTASAGNIDLSNAETQAIVGSLTATASGTLNNSAGNLEAGNGITLTSSSLNNAGGTIKNLGGINALITTTQAINNTALNGVSGFIGSNSNLTLATAALNNSSGKLYSFGDLRFDQAASTLDNNAGEMMSNGNITLNLASINNQSGSVLAGKNTSLTTHTVNGYSGLGTVTAYGDNNITLQGDYTHAAGNVFAANGNMTLTTAGKFTNKTTLEAGATLTLDAANIDNQSGAFINANTSVLTTTGDITNAGRIEGNSVETHSNNFTNNAMVVGNTLNLYANNLTNQTASTLIGATQLVNLIITNALVNQNGAYIFSLNDINIGSSNIIDPATDSVTSETVSVINRSATIEADNDLRISANTLTNKRTVVGVEWVSAGVGPVVVATAVPGGSSVDSYTTTYTDQQFTNQTTPEARLLSGKNMRLTGGALNNDYSTIIAGGALTAKMGVNNNGSEFLRMTTLMGESKKYSGTFVDQTGTCGFISINCVAAHIDWTLITTPFVTTTYAPKSGLLYTKLELLPAAFFAAKDNKTVSTTTAGSVAPVNATTLNASASTITLPTSGLYTIHSQPSQQYLVVTDPRFTNYQTFVSSDYMLSRLSLDSTSMQKRLGDGFYEQKLVNEQIMQQTGQRYLGQYASGNEQYAALLDAGVTAAQSLQLVPGIALTTQQIESLQRDIVWMEERAVTLPDGRIEYVLAPQLYLSKLSQADLSPSGSIIAANDIRIMGGDIANTGRIQGRNTNVLQANNITNTNGIIGSQGLTRLSAQKDILNRSGKINGKDVSLSAGRNILNQRTSSNFTTIKTSPAQSFPSRFGRGANSSVIETISGTTLGLGASISAANNLSMNAGRDLSIIGAIVASGGNASIAAGRDLNVGVVTVNQNASTSRYAASRNTTTQFGSGITTGGNLNMSSGNNMTLTAAALDVGTLRQTQGDRGDLVIVTGGDLSLASSKSSTQTRFDTGITQHKSLDEQVIGTSLNAQGNITLAATTRPSTPSPQSSPSGRGSSQGAGDEREISKGNVNLQSASISSANGKLAVIADKEVNITTTDEKHESFTQSRVLQKGLFSSKTTTTRDESTRTDAIGSNLDGDSVSIQSGKNISIKGSNVVANNDVTLKAANDISLTAAENTTASNNFKEEKTSGLYGNGGASLTLGNKQQSNAQTNQSITHTASTLGSLNGNLNFEAGNQFNQQGSDLLSKGDIDILAKQVNITAVQDIGSSSTESKTKQSGLTVSASSALVDSVVGAVNTVDQMGKAASKTSSSRLKKLAATSAALAANNAAGKISDTLANNASTLDKAGIKVGAALGNSSSESTSTQIWSQAQGSKLNADGNINIRATGASKDSNLTIQGSDVNAGNNVTLDAENQINLLAAQNTSTQTSSNKSSSNSLGLSANVGSNGMSINADIAASRGKGNDNGSDLAWRNTTLSSGNKLTLKSGGDTNLKGAVANGKQVIADVGGNLNLESLQDTSTYTSKQENAGINMSIPVFGAGQSSGGISYDKTQSKGNYTSVNQQSGIYSGAVSPIQLSPAGGRKGERENQSSYSAGDGGFQINVKGNTNLKGAVISSTTGGEAANTLTTATLTQSDLANRADASVETSGFNVSSDMFSQGAYGLAKGVLGNIIKNDNKSSGSSGSTRSTLSAGTLTLTNDAAQQALTGQTAKQTLASLNRDTTIAHTAAQKQDVEGMKQDMTIERAIEGEAYKQATVTTDEAYKTMFTKKHSLYEITKNADGTLNKNEMNGTDNLKTGEDRKIHLSTNGIFNSAEAATTYAGQHATDPSTQYLIAFPEANSPVAELVVAGYQKYMESDT
ncbi:MAG: hemagglutinin repeat-containing protein [Gallionella sp.]